MKQISSWTRWVRFAGVMILIAGVAGCAALMPKPDPSNPIRTIAILPFENGSNDVEAPNKVREALANRLRQKFYRVIDLNEIDIALRDELGITLGGQLREVEFADITEVIQADGIIYGNLTHYEHVVTGALNEKLVRAELNLIQVSTGQSFWSSELGVKSQRTDGGIGNLLALAKDVGQATNDDAIQWVKIQTQQQQEGGFMGNLLAGIADKVVSSALGVDLQQETMAFINHATNSLRNGPGN